jgi:outer membrane protein TolC
MRTGAAALVVAGLAVASARAQTPGFRREAYIAPGGLPTEALVERAIQDVPDLQSARARAAAAIAAERQAGERPNPMWMAEQRWQAGGSDRLTGVGVEWPLEPFRREARMAEAGAVSAWTAGLVRERERLVAAGVRARAAALVVAIAEFEVAQAVETSARLTYELIRARAEAGAAAPVERDLAFVEWQRLVASLRRQRAAIDVAHAELGGAVGLQPGAALVLRDDLAALASVADRPTLDPPAARQAIAARPDLVEAEAAAAVARARVESARQDRRFDLSLVGGYMRMASGFPQVAFDPRGVPAPIEGVFHNLSIGARVMLPIFDRGAGRVASAEQELAATRHDRDARRLVADTEVAAARARFDAAREVLSVYRGELPAVARRTLDVLRESHALGRVPLTDVLADQRRVLELELSRVAAEAEIVMARIELDRALGVVR